MGNALAIYFIGMAFSLYCNIKHNGGCIKFNVNGDYVWLFCMVVLSWAGVALLFGIRALFCFGRWMEKPTKWAKKI